MTHLLHQASSVIEGLGTLGPLAFILFYVVGTLVFFPHILLIMAAGALFSLPVGFALVSIAATLSAGIVFLAGRSWSRKWVIKKIALNPKTKALDDAVTREGWMMIVLLRQTSILPFCVMNYVLGLSKLSFKEYILATWLGMMPGQVLYVYLGSIAGKIAIEGHQGRKSVWEWIFGAVALAATIGIGVRATQIVKKALRVEA